MPNIASRKLTHAALIAAVYVLLTVLFSAFSFGSIQFRIAEALTLLPILTPAAIPGLFVGCLLANLLGGGVWFDIAVGSLATLLAAVIARRLRKHPILAAAAPVLLNGVMVGPVVYLAYVRSPGSPVMWSVLTGVMGSVALGEAAVCYTLGLLLLAALKRFSRNDSLFFKNS